MNYEHNYQGTIFPAIGPVPLTNAAASVSLSQSTFTLFPGQSKTITARFNLPNGDASTFPVFSGFIQITSGTERLHVTYIGLAASLKDKQVVDNTNTFFGVPIPAILDPSGNIQAGPRNYTFANSDVPTVLFR
jgi:Fn3-like domain